MLLTDLNDHPRNDEIRNHPEPGTDKWRELEVSLQHDYYDPLVFNERNGFLVSGHLRKKVLLHLGYTHADVVVVSYDDTTHMARMVSANRGVGEDDTAGLKAMFEEFASIEDFEPGLAGCTDSEVRGLIPNVENIPWLEPGAQRDDGEGSNNNTNNDPPSGRRALELIVEFTPGQEEELEALYDEMVERGMRCRILNL